MNGDSSCRWLASCRIPRRFVSLTVNITEAHVCKTDNRAGEGHLDSTSSNDNKTAVSKISSADPQTLPASFAPPNSVQRSLRFSKSLPQPRNTQRRLQSSISRIHNAWSTAVNSRIGRADNARFVEHFRYTIVASQLLNEYLDQGALPPPSHPSYGLDGASEGTYRPSVTTSIYGAACTAAAAFALVYLIHWARGTRDGIVSKSRVALVLLVFVLAAFVLYLYVRRQWLKFLRRNAVAEVANLTANWQAFEVSASSALSLIQEVELVSKGYHLAAPLPPASRIEDQAASRRCGRLRRSLHKAYTAVLSTCIGASHALRDLIEEDDLDKYFEVYDIGSQDVKEALNSDAFTDLGNDPESLKSLRVLGYRAGLLRRVVLSSLMALEADGGKPDFHRWRVATEIMNSVSTAVGASAEKVQQCLSDMETVATPIAPTATRWQHDPAKDKLRGQVRKISMLSSGIRTLQAKMQVLREETNRSIERSDDLADLGPSLMSQYESIGEDLKELMQAWEAGKATLQSNLTKHERRISLASGARSPVSSLGGLTAVDEDGSPAAALKALTGETLSNRSSMATTPSEDEVFEAIAMPRQRSTITREERIHKMQEERERQAILRAKRDANTSMLRELESVINLRPKKTGATRITSI